MQCEICEKSNEKIWGVEKGIIPNRYYSSINQTQYFEQEIFFCSQCDYIFNKHSIPESEMYKDYVYRTPNTSEDDEAVKVISKIIKDENIKTVFEVGGNNGVFAKKILDKSFDVSEYLIWDKVNSSEAHEKLQFQNKYLTSSTVPAKADLVIVRHAFAHNSSITKFSINIADKFDPEFIYIECADWVKTRLNRDFSQLYPEHFYCLSGKSVERLFSKLNYFKLAEVNLRIHNGSFGLLLGKKGRHEDSNVGTKNHRVVQDIQDWIADVNSFWNELRISDLNIWGCSAKFLFTINALNLKNKEQIKMVIDSTANKQGMFPPGLACPVSPEPNSISGEDLSFIVGARNFASQIEKKITTLSPNYSSIIPPF